MESSPRAESPFGMRLKSINATSLVVVMLVGAALIVIKYCFKKPKLIRHPNRRSPPGPPFALPLLGHLLQMGSRPSIAFRKWRKAYGPVFSLQLGSLNAVVVSDPKLVKQVFSHPASTGRMNNAFTDVFSGGKNGQFGIINRDDEGWVHQRRFTLRTLKDLGLNKGVLEGVIGEEAGRLVTFFEKRANLPIPGNRVFNGAVLNSLWTILTGERHEWDVPLEPEHLAKSERVMRTANRGMETGLAFFPWVRFLAPSWSGWNDWVEANRDLLAFARGIIEGHLVARRDDHVTSSADYVDLYLAEVEATTGPTTSSFYGAAGIHSLTGNVADLILAGTETTSTTLEYIMLYLSKYRHAQDEIHSEVDAVVGRKRAPNLSDRRNLPYTEAVILEVQRLSSILPIGAPHRALEDIELASSGHVIPKEALIFADFYNIHRDPKIWGEDADEFRPERFLDETRTKVVYHEALLPFSTGRRACIGEGLANDSLFIFLACLMQKFEVKLGDDERIDLDDPLPGFVSKPKPFKMVMCPRMESDEKC